MADMLAIAQGLNALKAMMDIGKAMVGLRDAAQILEKTVELNQKILSVQTALADAQAEQTTLVQTIGQLEEEIVRLKTWETEKKRYQLTEVAPRTFTYVLKPEMANGEPPHWICAACYQNGKISILQGKESHTFGWYHSCPSCSAEINTGFSGSSAGVA
jgi:seryl-tRNA synthetase